MKIIKILVRFICFVFLQLVSRRVVLRLLYWLVLTLVFDDMWWVVGFVLFKVCFFFWFLIPLLDPVVLHFCLFCVLRCIFKFSLLLVLSCLRVSCLVLSC